MRIALALIPMLILAGCGGDEANGTIENSAPVANVAAPAGTNWVAMVAKTPEGGYLQGNPNAPIKLVEYGSRSCPTCGRFAMEGVEPLREKYISTGKVSYEFREFFVHPQDLGIALLGRCVPTETFFPILDAMYAAQPQFNERQTQVTEAMFQQIQAMPPLQAAGTWADVLGYTDFIKQRGVPEAKARQCLSDQAQLKTLADQMEAAAAKGVSGTPSFFINDRKVNAAVWADVEPLLRAAGAR